MTGFAQPDQPHWGGNKDIQRDRWGRPLVTPPEGGKPVGYTRCTTFIDSLSDKTNLMQWKMRLVAQGLSQRDDLLLRVGQTPPDDKTAFNKLVNEAADVAGMSAAAELGTQIHEATERFDHQREVGPLGKYQPDLDAYAINTLPIEYLAIEQFRVQDNLQIGGTADRIAKIDGKSVVCDIKTGGLYDVGKMAMQLAVYAHSVPYDPATGQRGQDTPPMDTERGLLIHLPAGQGECTLYWLNLNAGWQAVQIAHQVREWRKFADRKATRDQLMAPYNQKGA